MLPADVLAVAQLVCVLRKGRGRARRHNGAGPN